MKKFARGDVLRAADLNAIISRIERLEAAAKIDVGPGLMLDQSAAGTVITLAGNKAAAGTAEAAESTYPFRIWIETTDNGRKAIHVDRGTVYWQTVHFQNDGTSTRILPCNYQGTGAGGYLVLGENPVGTWTIFLEVYQYGIAAEIVFEEGEVIDAISDNKIGIGVVFGGFFRSKLAIFNPIPQKTFNP